MISVGIQYIESKVMKALRWLEKRADINKQTNLVKWLMWEVDNQSTSIKLCKWLLVNNTRRDC